MSPLGGTADSCPVADFGAGPIEIMGITVGELKERAQTQLEARGSYWEGSDAEGNKYRISRMF